MASVKCEQCGRRIGASSFRKQAYILEDEEWRTHYFCSPVCADLWCKKKIDEGCDVGRTPFEPEKEADASGFKESKYVPEGVDALAPIPSSRFTCPGCGEKATSKHASLCPACGHFVHHGCARKGFVTWSCPICDVGLVGQT